MNDADPRIQQIIQRVAEGDVVAYEQLCLLMHPRLRAVARSGIPADMQALIDPDDVLQDAYYDAFRCRKDATLQDAGAAYAWLVTILRNRLNDLIRAHRALKRGSGQLAGQARTDSDVVTILSEVAQHRRTPSASAARHEAIMAIEAAIDALPADYRQAITLHHIEGHPFKAVATIMQRSEGSATMLCNRAIKMLRKHLGDESSFF